MSIYFYEGEMIERPYYPMPAIGGLQNPPIERGTLIFCDGCWYAFDGYGNGNPWVKVEATDVPKEVRAKALLLS